MPPIQPDAESTTIIGSGTPLIARASGDFARYRSRTSGREVFARLADKPFVVQHGHIESRGDPGWWECRYVEADGGPSRNGWAMTPAGFERLYEAVNT